MQVFAKPSPRAFDGNILDFKTSLAELGHRPSRKIDSDRLDHPASAKCGFGAATDQQSLIYVVMKDLSEALPVGATEVATQRFRERIADRVRVTEAFALHDLDLAVQLGQLKNS